MRHFTRKKVSRCGTSREVWRCGVSGEKPSCLYQISWKHDIPLCALYRNAFSLSVSSTGNCSRGHLGCRSNRQATVAIVHFRGCPAASSDAPGSRGDTSRSGRTAFDRVPHGEPPARGASSRAATVRLGRPSTGLVWPQIAAEPQSNFGLGRVGEMSSSSTRLHAVPFFSLSNWETEASEIHDRARDWSEQGRRLRPSSPFSARLCLSLAPESRLLWTRKERGCVQSIYQPMVVAALSYPKVLVSFSRISFPETMSIPNKRLLSCAKELRRTNRYEVKCSKTLCAWSSVV